MYTWTFNYSAGQYITVNYFYFYSCVQFWPIICHQSHFITYYCTGCKICCPVLLGRKVCMVTWHARFLRLPAGCKI